MEVEIVHHVSLAVTDLERSRRFYRDILGLKEIRRPEFDFPGAWFQVGGNQQLHLIVHDGATFRGSKGVDTRDVHFAVRVKSYRQALEFLRVQGYSEDADDSHPQKIKPNLQPVAGFPQIHMLDPDRHVIEINAERLD
jgi:glyoxylase I family protein